MTRAEAADLFACMTGEKSNLNLLGKVVLSPLVVATIGGWALLDVLFTKKPPCE